MHWLLQHLGRLIFVTKKLRKCLNHKLLKNCWWNGLQGSISSKYAHGFFARLLCWIFLSDYFCQMLSLAKFNAFCGEWRLANGTQIWRISTYIIGINIIDEIEWHFFPRLLCAGEFLLGAQSLVKLTPEVHRLIIQSRFGNPPNNQFN